MSQIETIEDLMRATYQGNYAARVLGIMPKDFRPTQQFGDMLKSDELRKADDQFTTGDTAYFNPIYGMAAFMTLRLLRKWIPNDRITVGLITFFWLSWNVLSFLHLPWVHPYDQVILW